MKKDALSVLLACGRELSYLERGSEEGLPVFYFHGLPGSRFDLLYLQSLLESKTYRLISVDRPGIGRSTPDPDRSILSFAKDIESLANHLGIDQFSMLGHSGGAPYVAACAFKMPNRIVGAAIVSGMAPFEIPEAKAALNKEQRYANALIRLMPWTAKIIMKMMSIMIKRPSMIKKVLKQLPEIEQVLFDDPIHYSNFIEAVMEAFKNGVRGSADEMQLMLKPWGFPLESIQCPLTIWQGGLDKQAPLKHAEIFANRIPGARLSFFKDEGHMSLLINQAETILQTICTPSV